MLKSKVGIIATRAKSLMGWSPPMAHHKNGKKETLVVSHSLIPSLHNFCI